METNIISKKEINYDRVRIPKQFQPLKYNLNFYLDIKNLAYEVELQIELQVIDPNAEMIILNANKTYNIEELTIAKYDPISDHYGEKTKINFLFDDDIKSELMNTYIYQHYSKIQPEIENTKNSDKLKLLISELKENYSEFYSKNSEILNYENFGLIDYLDKKDSLVVIEESIYIPVDRSHFNLKENDKLILCFKVSGEVILSSKRACGLYLSIFGHDAKLLDKPAEFFSLWHDDSKNESLMKNAVFTALNEPVDARTYMPCFDEPCFKAKFNVRISIDKKIAHSSPHFRVVSNGDLLDITENISQARYTYKFSESPLMSIYLLTFVVGRFEYLESIIGSTRLRVYTPVNCVCEGTFAMEIAKKSLEFYQNYFKIPYSFPKLDLVPVPAMDYRAMENWGCIVYLNYALMAKKFLDIKERKNIARTNAHELSHMWFGNLVTMDWWDDIWLNEGFARFMEFECLDKIKPEFEIWSKYIELIFQNAMDIDEKPTTHPVRCIVPSPRKVMDIFDTISYAKGASIIRMLSNYVGKEQFRLAIIAYMEKFQFKNTVTKNLWDTFKETINIDVEPIMDSWLNLAGHPKLEIGLVKENENENGNWNLVLQQNAYPSNYNKSINDPIWKIPLFIKTKDKEFTFLIEDKEFKINIQELLNITYEDLITNKNFIKVNYDMKGFYRVKYTNPILFNCLLSNSTNLSKLDICGLLSDTLADNDIITCLTILDKVKPISNYLILNYAMKIYNIIKESAFQYTCFEDILNKHDVLFKIKYEELINLQIKCKKFFFGLISVDKNELINRIYLTDSSHYLNEEQDEFLELVLHFYTFIEKDEELITHIIENFESGHPRLHKNLKYGVNSIMTNYSYTVHKNIEKEKVVYEQILNEYISSYYDTSLQGRSAFKISLIHFEDSSDSLIEFFAEKLQGEHYMKHLYFKNINLFRSFPNNRKRFLDTYIKMLKDKYAMLNDKKEMTWSDVLNNGTNRIAAQDLPIVFYEIYDTHLREVIRDYIIEELKKVDDNDSMDHSDEHFKCIHNLVNYGPNGDYCSNAESVLNQVLSFFRNK